MALRLNDMSDKSTAQINRWADVIEGKHNAYDRQLAQLNQYITKLHELNPGLTRPDLK